MYATFIYTKVKLMQQEEIWLPVLGRESFYEVSNTGKIRSLVNRYKTKGVFELKQTVDKKGYCSLDLSKPTHKKELVHRVVASTFLAKPEGCDVVNHLDNNPSNNNVNNLEWTTTSGNLLHAQKQGRLTEAQAKGGYVTTKASRQRVSAEVNAMIGTMYGSLKVLALSHVRKYGRANRPILSCECTCGKEYLVCKIQLDKGSATMCKPCSASALAKRVMLKIVEDYKNTQIAHFTFNGNSNIDTAATTKQLKLFAECGSCGNEQMLPYSGLNKSKLTCSKCKKHKDIV